MEQPKLGRSDMVVSQMALGCWALAGGSNWGTQEDEDSIATVHAALDAGINFFDTAVMYGDGHSEELLGRALEGRRSQAVIATKFNSGCQSGAEILDSCEKSLARLRTDTIDLYQVHWRSRSLPVPELIGALEKLKSQGKIREYGVCNFGPMDLAEILPQGRLVSNQLPYNLLCRAIEFEIVEPCLENGLSILPYCPLMQGLLTGKFHSADEVPEGRARSRHFSPVRSQVRHGEEGCEEETFAAIEKIRQISERVGETMAHLSLAWLLEQPGVTSILVGARSPEQVWENVGAARLKLPPEILQELTDATDLLKTMLGLNPDLWQSQSRFR